MTTTIQTMYMSDAFKRQRLWGRLTLIVTGSIIVFLVIIAISADFIAPHDPVKVSLPNMFKPPVWQEGGNWSYPLGSDSLGRDLLSRMIYGTRVSMMVALLAIALGAGIGSIIGIAAGFLGGWLDATLMRVVDAVLSFPIILVGLFTAIIVGPGLFVVVLAISFVLWARFARVVRGEVLSLKEREFVALSRLSGASAFRIAVRHLLPNVANTIVVMATFQIGFCIIVEASLSFVGAGIPPPTPTWGGMVADGRDYIQSAWWISALPGLALLITVLAFNLFGDWLRDALDPKLRQL